MFYRFLVAVFILLIAPTALAGSVYKCKLKNGRLEYQETPCADNDQSVSSWNANANPNGNNTLVLGQGAGGHYFVNGSINDHSLNFAIDTGASQVTLPLETASSAGLRCKHLTNLQTANGATRSCLTTIDKLTFGGFTLYYVDAIVAPNLNQPLLGMNVLKQFHIEQDGNQLHISRSY